MGKEATSKKNHIPICTMKGNTGFASLQWNIELGRRKTQMRDEGLCEQIVDLLRQERPLMK
jgi:hypothetical protein